MTVCLFTLFDTPVGSCAIAWTERGVVGIHLPEGRERDTLARVLQRFPDAREAVPPPAIQCAVDEIIALLSGEASDLSTVVLDMEHVPPFHRRVYEVARAIPPGATSSYGNIAARLDAPGSARAVGQALGRNPFAIVVPCHRVLAAGGKLGGFSANGGIVTKLRLLSIESTRAKGPSRMFEGDGEFGFDTALAVAHLRGSDPKLAQLIDSVGPFRMRLRRAPSVFGALAEAIVYQQLNGKAAATIYARLCALFPHAHEGPTPAHILRASDEKLRSAGLSGSKLLSLRDLARRAGDGGLPDLAEIHRLENEEIVERLTQVRGVGRWTAEMFLMSRLGRPDVLPVDDFGIRKGFAVAFKKREMPAPKVLEKYGARWKPYRTVASWYLWRAADQASEYPVLKGSRCAPTQKEFAANLPSLTFILRFSVSPVKRPCADLGEEPLAECAVGSAILLDNVIADLISRHTIERLSDRIDPGDVPEIIVRIVDAKRGAVHQEALCHSPGVPCRRDPHVLNSPPLERPVEVDFR